MAVCHDTFIKFRKEMFGGSFLHDSITKIAAAYGFHLCNNHAFIDGNKRIAFVAMDTFMQKDGYEICVTEKEVYGIMIKLASGKLTKEDLLTIHQVSKIIQQVCLPFRNLTDNMSKAYRYVNGEFREGKFEFMQEPSGSMSSSASDMAKFNRCIRIWFNAPIRLIK